MEQVIILSYKVVVFFPTVSHWWKWASQLVKQGMPVFKKLTDKKLKCISLSVFTHKERKSVKRTTVSSLFGKITLKPV